MDVAKSNTEKALELSKNIKPLYVEQKPWGRTELLFYSPFFQLNRVYIERGGYSSIHYHKTKENYFFVFEGKLLINQFRNILGKAECKENLPKEYFLEDRYIRTSNDLLLKAKTLSVPALRLHQFYALTDVIGIEWYVQSQAGVDISLEDIIRVTQNGKEVH